MYSQHGEDEIVMAFFKGKKDGRFLDIGAYDGKIFSNTYILFERGWDGVCVEASPQCFMALQKQYEGSPHIKVVCAAMHDKSGCFLFYDNGGAVATLSKTHMEQWKKPQSFKEIFVAAVTPAQFFQILPGPYDFLTLDIEDDSIRTLTSFPSLKVLGLSLVCVEAYDASEKEAVDVVMKKRGYAFHASTELNVFYRRV